MAEIVDDASVSDISVRRWPRTLVRVLAVVALLQVFAQAALAGAFVTGDVDQLSVHNVNGSLLLTTAFALWLACVLLFRPGRGPWWPILFSSAFAVLVTLQLGFGLARQVGLHIPVGVALMGMISVFAAWAWRR